MATQQRQPAESVRIQSVDRAVDLLLALAAAPPAAATAPALARACGLNRATAWRLLKTLQGRGLVTVDDATGAGRGRAPGAGADQRADRGDRVAGRARGGRADLCRRGDAGRGGDRELAGSIGAGARHVDR